MPSLLDRLLNIATAGDELANTVVGGKPRETLSGSIGRAYLAGKWWALSARWLVDLVFGEGHCDEIAAAEAAARDVD